MTPDSSGAAARLVDRFPELSAQAIVSHLVPPRQFADASFESYRPDRDYPSQGAALAAVRTLAQSWTSRGGGGLFSRRKQPETLPGVYLDGGFGVGKTHLLAALWHAAPGRKYFGTFIEYTALVGAVGYATAVDLLKGATLVAIDEFELDDPGDTMIMTRLLGELAASGSKLAATSNTPPNALGEGRFAAQDFLREIQSLASKFTTIRIDGLDYRHRDAAGAATALTEEQLVVAASGAERRTEDDFDALIAHLADVHPSRYVELVAGLDAVVLREVHPFTSQTDALRFVAFVDRLYDAQVRVLATGTPFDQVFPEEMLGGGYRKKYLRATSRLVALTAPR